ncbi:unnamed protein product, partial [Heligmosomoides polygyrus]|uniref:Uncharacterized protein n=1 Tax=Heligmosomoides polygyrus TaxID=6339 RepID=A0A183FC01_HELPZ
MTHRRVILQFTYPAPTIFSSIFVRQCLRKPVVNPVEDEAIVGAASSRNLPHAADEEDRVEGQLQQPGKFLHVLPMLPSLDVSRSTAVLATAPITVAAPTAPQLQGSWAEQMEAETSIQSQQARREADSQVSPALVSSAKRPRATAPTPVQKEGKAPAAPEPPVASPRKEPAQVGTTGQGTAREEPTLAANYPRYQELLALLQIRLNTGAPSDSSATAAQSSAAASSDARSTHQLTETGFRTVFDYINVNNLLRPSIAALKIPVKEVTPSRRADYESVARIVELLRFMQELSTTTTQRFHNL